VTATSLEIPKVRSYLRELDSALLFFRTEEARELKDQITAHLDEALPWDAGDE
jgi:hypothetical protein